MTKRGNSTPAATTTGNGGGAGGSPAGAGGDNDKPEATDEAEADGQAQMSNAEVTAAMQAHHDARVARDEKEPRGGNPARLA